MILDDGQNMSQYFGKAGAGCRMFRWFWRIGKRWGRRLQWQMWECDRCWWWTEAKEPPEQMRLGCKTPPRRGKEHLMHDKDMSPAGGEKYSPMTASEITEALEPDLEPSAAWVDPPDPRGVMKS